MSEQNASNPYSDDEPKLQKAWEEGFRAARRGFRRRVEIDDPDPVLTAWMKGYKAATADDQGR